MGPDHRIFAVQYPDHQEGTLAYEERLKVSLQLAAFEKTEPAKVANMHKTLKRLTNH